MKLISLALNFYFFGNSLALIPVVSCKNLYELFSFLFSLLLLGNSTSLESEAKKKNYIASFETWICKGICLETKKKDIIKQII